MHDYDDPYIEELCDRISDLTKVVNDLKKQVTICRVIQCVGALELTLRIEHVYPTPEGFIIYVR